MFSISSLIIECFHYFLIFLIITTSNVTVLKSLNLGELKEWFKLNHWALYLLFGIFFVPISLTHFSIVGADLNSFSYVEYFWAIGICVFIANNLNNKNLIITRLLTILLLSLYITLRLPTLFNLRESFAIATNSDERVAFDFAKSHPNQVYFPNNPLPTIYSDNKLYHIAHGLYVREMIGYPVDKNHFNEHIPTNLKYIVFPSRSKYNYNYIFKYLPKFNKPITIDELPDALVFIRSEE